MVTNPDHVRDKKTETAAVLLVLAADTGKVAGLCLSAEEMAALVDGRVKAPASAAYLAHLGSCGKCYEEWLLLKKGTQLGAPRRLYGLHRIKKFSYIGSALAVAASIAIYLNIGNLADRTLEKAVPGPALLQDRGVGPAPQRQEIDKIEKDQGSPVKEQNDAGASAKSAAPPRLREQAQGRPAPAPVSPAGTEQFRAGRAKRIAEPAPAVGTAQPEGMAVKEAASAPAGRQAAPAAPPVAADLADWLGRLRAACQADRHGAEFWAEMVDRGEGLQLGGDIAPAEPQRPRIATLLALLRGMNDSASETRQCRLILAELAKDGKNQ
jgi:hypothetical protein